MLGHIGTADGREELVEVDPPSAQPGALDADPIDQLRRVDGPRVGGQLHEVGQLAHLDRADQVLAAKCAGRVDGLRPPCLVERDGLVRPVHPTGAGAPGDRGRDVDHRRRRRHRPVVVQRHARPGRDRVAERGPPRSVLMVEHRAVEQIAPVVVLERRQRHVHTQAGGPVEMVPGARPTVLQAPPVVGAEQVVSGQRGLVRVEREIQRQIAVGVERHLPAGRCGPVQDRVQLLAAVVHRVDAARGRRVDPCGPGGLGVQIRERDRDVADPRRTVGPQLHPGLRQPLLACRESRGLGIGLAGRHLPHADPQRTRRGRRERLIACRELRVEGHVRRRGVAAARHQREVQRPGHQRVAELGHDRARHRGEHR